MKLKFSAMFFILLSAANLNAIQVNLPLDTAYVTPAVTPVGTSPWLVADFQDLLPNSVQLTLRASGLAAGSTQFADNWFFNTTDSILGLLNFQFVSGNQASIFLAPNHRQAGGGLLFDIEFDFAGGLFAAGGQSVYLISSLDPSRPITAESFALLSGPDSSQVNYYSAALVQGISAGLSSWIAAASATIIEPGPGPDPDPGPGPVPVSEPATLVLLAFSLGSLIVFGRKIFFA
jgi:hypothetical protein